jgi:hypothetical protein
MTMTRCRVVRQKCGIWKVLQCGVLPRTSTFGRRGPLGGVPPIGWHPRGRALAMGRFSLNDCFRQLEFWPSCLFRRLGRRIMASGTRPILGSSTGEVKM